MFLGIMHEKFNKSLAVAKMGDRARAKWAEKWGLICPFAWRELGLHLTTSPESRTTYVPSVVFIHPTVWPQYTNVCTDMTHRRDRQTTVR